MHEAGPHTMKTDPLKLRWSPDTYILKTPPIAPHPFPQPLPPSRDRSQARSGEQVLGQVLPQGMSWVMSLHLSFLFYRMKVCGKGQKCTCFTQHPSDSNAGAVEPTWGSALWSRLFLQLAAGRGPWWVWEWTWRGRVPRAVIFSVSDGKLWHF